MPSKPKLPNVIEIEHDGLVWFVCFSNGGGRVVCLRHRDPNSSTGWWFICNPNYWRKPPYVALIEEAKRRQCEPVAAT